MFETQGIVLRTVNFSDYDKMVTLFTKDDIVAFLAKGANKYQSKNGPAVLEFTHGLYEISKTKNGNSLRRGSIINSFPKVKEDIVSLAILDFIKEITIKLIDRNDVYKIYPFLEKSLYLLEDGYSKLITLLVYFAKVLSASGYALNVDSCVRSGNKENIIGLSFSDGGFISEGAFNYLEDTKLTIEEMKIIRYIFKVDIERFGTVDFLKEIPTSNVKKIISLLNDFLVYISSIKLNSIELLNKLL